MMAAVILKCSIETTAEENDTYLSDRIISACEVIGNEYAICPELLEAIIEKESSGSQYASNGGCMGLMQISEKWHKDRMQRLGVTDIFDVEGNILVGTDYLAELFEEYEDPGMVLMVYNGDSRAESFGKGEAGLSSYASWILNRAAELEELHGI